MTEIDDLIRQMKEAQESWKRPNPDEPKRRRIKTWQEVLDSRIAPPSSRQ